MHRGDVRAIESSQALARTMRRLAVYGPGDPGARHELRAAYGPAALRITLMLQLFMTRMADCATAPLLLAAPCCRCLSTHERAMLGAVGAAADGDWAAAHLALGGLVRPDASTAAVAAAAGLAEALVDCGGPVPRRGPRPVIN